MADFSIDTSDLRRLAVDLGTAPARTHDQVRKVTQRAALNIKRDLQEEAEGSARFSGIPASISYETWEKRDGIGAEIGPQIGRRQGSLAFIAYEGTARSGPVFPDPAGALDREAETFQDYLARAVAEDLL